MSSTRSMDRVAAATRALDPTIRALVESAIRSPSAHNTQPWQLRVLDANSIQLVHTRDDRLPNDPNDRDVYLAHGCFVESLILASQLQSVDVQFSPEFTQERDSIISGTIHFSPSTSSPLVDPLAHSLAHRHTNRGPYRKGPAPTRLTDDLLALGNKQLGGQQIRPLIISAYVASFNDPEFLNDLSEWLRSNSSAPDGLTRQSLRLTWIKWLALMATIRIGRVSRPAGRILFASEMNLFGSEDAAIYVLGSASLAPSDLFESGRRMFRSWCAIASHGWATHPMFALIDRPETASEIARISEQQFPVAIYRAGSPLHAAKPSKRHGIEHFSSRS